MGRDTGGGGKGRGGVGTGVVDAVGTLGVEVKVGEGWG